MNWALTLGLIFISSIILAQDATLADKYLVDYQNSETDSARCRNLWQVAFNLSGSDPSKGIQYGKQALQLAEKVENYQLIGDSHNSLGFCFDSAGNADSSAYHFEQSLLSFDKANLSCEKAGVYSNMGNSLKRRGDTQKALELFLKAAQIQENCPDIGYHGSTIYSIGTCYNSLGDYTRALEYFNKSLELEIKNNNKSKQGYCYNGMANAYLGQNDLINAQSYYLKALKVYEESGDIANIAYIYEGLAQLFDKDNKLDSAIHYAKKALNVFTQTQVNYDIVYESILLADLYIKSDSLDLAEKLLIKTLPVCQEDKLHYDEQVLLSKLAVVYEMQGEYKLAFDYLKRCKILADSLAMDEQKTNLAEIAGKYETEKRDKLIALQAADNERKDSQNRIYIGLILLLVVVIGFFAKIFQQKRKSARLLEEKNKEIDKARIRAEQSEKFKEQFLANMSHEIRTPMNAIIGLSGLLTKKDFDERTRQFINAIHHSGNNLLVVLNDILDLAKIQSGKLTIHKKPLNLKAELQALNNMFEVLASSKKLKLFLEIDHAVPEFVKTDGPRLVQILSNLLSNAVKFTESGSVTLRAQLVEKAGQLVLKFQVIDTGPGISANQLEAIFESFVQTEAGSNRKYGGTGLGLSISKNLCLAMGADISVRSEEGKGSEFTIEIPVEPVSDEEIKIISHSPLTNFTSNQKIKVLIAEDNDFNFLLSEQTLLEFFPNAIIHRAHNGKDAAADALDEEYDIILMDVQMPEMDGYAATMEIRKTDTQTPIIALTASVIQNEIDNCFKAGMNEVLLKPIEAKNFITSICHCLKIDMNDNQQFHSTLDYHQLFMDNIIPHLQALKELHKSKDYRKVASIIHQIRPQILKYLGTALSPDLDVLEFDSSNKEYNTKLESLIIILETKVNQ
jgi:signal transduction histidine kinase/CheY-like chemotaxis protein/Tfp pilus assembly protein PilF